MQSEYINVFGCCFSVTCPLVVLSSTTSLYAVIGLAKRGGVDQTSSSISLRGNYVATPILRAFVPGFDPTFVQLQNVNINIKCQLPGVADPHQQLRFGSMHSQIDSELVRYVWMIG